LGVFFFRSSFLQFSKRLVTTVPFLPFPPISWLFHDSFFGLYRAILPEKPLRLSPPGLVVNRNSTRENLSLQTCSSWRILVKSPPFCRTPRASDMIPVDNLTSGPLTHCCLSIEVTLLLFPLALSAGPHSHESIFPRVCPLVLRFFTLSLRAAVHSALKSCLFFSLSFFRIALSRLILLP